MANLRFLSMIGVNPQGSAPFILVGANDRPQVSVLDTLYPANLALAVYRSHVIINNESTQEPLTAIIKGEGTIVAGAAILWADGIRWEARNILFFPGDANNDELSRVTFSRMPARQFSIELAISGYNLNIRSIIAQFADIGT